MDKEKFKQAEHLKKKINVFKEVFEYTNGFQFIKEEFECGNSNSFIKEVPFNLIGHAVMADKETSERFLKWLGRELLAAEEQFNSL